MVKSIAGIYFKDGRTLTTSGHSTGTIKNYRWGPAFPAAFKFTEWSRFEGFPRDHKVLLRVRPPGLPLYSGEAHGLHVFNISTADLAGTARQVFRHFPKGRTCWFLLPTYAQALVDHVPQIFDELDPARHMFEATGEPSSRALRQFFRDRGLFYLDQMRSWMGGATFITCPHGNQHFLDFMSEIKTEDAGGGLVELVTTDFWNLAQPFINFPTGDIVDWTRRGICACGYPIDDFEFMPRSPVMVVNGSPLRFIDLAVAVGTRCKSLLSLQKLCVSFCLDRDTMFVDLIVNGSLRGVDVSPLERDLGDYLGLKCVVQERLSATQYKTLAIRLPGEEMAI